ncbi:MAG: gamma-glutamylcyclotransferase [Rhodobacteraceae bacterium]|nr:gamma-glutamylcyclotransferase [Paracoccaceae bacterium]MCP5342043.1 gamma-glutamylcyclotransferase [Paracoccaceae bacterium]
MSSQKFPAFFGYGSLVNRATHDYAPAVPARLRGWRRVWRHTVLRPFAFLSVEPADAEIDGLVAAVPHGDWSALDQREAAYDRTGLAAGALRHDAGWAQSVEIYAVARDHADPAARHPILLSYLDVVVQGFLREFGTTGANGFFASTQGWETAILDDRAAPVYPRHQVLTKGETAFVDETLHRLGIKTAP